MRDAAFVADAGRVATRLGDRGLSVHVAGARSNLIIDPTSIARGPSSLARNGAWSLLDDGRAVRGDASLREELDLRVSGLEQSWRFGSKPAGDGDVIVRVPMRGARLVSSDGADIIVDAGDGRSRVRYSHATWVDAAGARTEIAATWKDGAVLLCVPREIVEDATYPVVLDPTISAPIAIDAPGTIPDPKLTDVRVANPGGHPLVIGARGIDEMLVWTVGSDGKPSAAPAATLHDLGSSLNVVIQNATSAYEVDPSGILPIGLDGTIGTSLPVDFLGGDGIGTRAAVGGGMIWVQPTSPNTDIDFLRFGDSTKSTTSLPPSTAGAITVGAGFGSDGTTGWIVSAEQAGSTTYDPTRFEAVPIAADGTLGATMKDFLVFHGTSSVLDIVDVEYNSTSHEYLLVMRASLPQPTGPNAEQGAAIRLNSSLVPIDAAPFAVGPPRYLDGHVVETPTGWLVSWSDDTGYVMNAVAIPSTGTPPTPTAVKTLPVPPGSTSAMNFLGYDPLLVTANGFLRVSGPYAFRYDTSLAPIDTAPFAYDTNRSFSSAPQVVSLGDGYLALWTDNRSGANALLGMHLGLDGKPTSAAATVAHTASDGFDWSRAQFVANGHTVVGVLSNAASGAKTTFESLAIAVTSTAIR
ncbi:MAG: hypothetical protein ACHREM_30000, partial [Polyangiales bacterium]